MRTLLRFVIVFFIVSAATTVLVREFHVPFGRINFWDVHGALFLMFLALFPRLTLLLSNVALGGPLWWLGWIFAPRLLVAVLATFAYWQTNPMLVTIAWLIATFGESSEKLWLARTRRRVVHRRVWLDNGVKHEVIDVTDSSGR